MLGGGPLQWDPSFFVGLGVRICRDIGVQARVVDVSRRDTRISTHLARTFANSRSICTIHGVTSVGCFVCAFTSYGILLLCGPIGDCSGMVFSTEPKPRDSGEPVLEQ